MGKLLGNQSALAPAPRSLHAHPQKHHHQSAATMAPDAPWSDPSDPADPSRSFPPSSWMPALSPSSWKPAAAHQFAAQTCGQTALLSLNDLSPTFPTHDEGKMPREPLDLLQGTL